MHAHQVDLISRVSAHKSFIFRKIDKFFFDVIVNEDTRARYMRMNNCSTHIMLNIFFITFINRVIYLNRRKENVTKIELFVVNHVYKNKVIFKIGCKCKKSISYRVKKNVLNFILFLNKNLINNHIIRMYIKFNTKQDALFLSISRYGSTKIDL